MPMRLQCDASTRTNHTVGTPQEVIARMKEEGIQGLFLDFFEGHERLQGWLMAGPKVEQGFIEHWFAFTLSSVDDEDNKSVAIGMAKAMMAIQAIAPELMDNSWVTDGEAALVKALLECNPDSQDADIVNEYRKAVGMKPQWLFIVNLRLWLAGLFG